MTDESKEIIKRLKECIENSGLTYLELEKRTGIAKSSLQRYANGVTKKIPVDSIQIIAKTIGVAPEYILGWDSTNSSNFNLSPIDNITKSENKKIALTEHEDEQKQQLLHNYDKMNETAQNTLVKYSEFMASQPENLKIKADNNKMNA